jgi:cytochrome c553
MPKHIIRLLLILGTALILAVVARKYLVDPSFYKFGDYRADAVAELASGTPQIKGPAYCRQCHVDRHAEWSQGVHHTVKCEVCHGPARDHPASGKLPIPADTIKTCTICHEAMPARPASQPQIVVAEHPFPHEGALPCKNCHNPHSPRIGGAEAEGKQGAAQAVKEAFETEAPVSVPASASGCVACHGAQGEGIGSFPALAGKEAVYFDEQMNRYRSGDRQNPMMETIAKSLSDEEIAELAEYYAGLAAKSPGDQREEGEIP